MRKKTLYKNKHGFIPIFIILIIAIVGIGAYILGSKNISQTPTIWQTSTPTPTNSPPIAVLFKKRQFDINKEFFYGKPYPTELAVSEAQLTDMNCSPKYLSDYRGGFNYPKGETTQVTNIKFHDLIESASTTIDVKTKDIAGEEIAAGQYCEKKDSLGILEYEIWSGGGGTGNIAYFGLTDSEAKHVTKVASIPNDGVAYFGCQILQLVNNTTMHVNCTGGDGGGGGSSLYSINLSTGATTKLVKCISSTIMPVDNSATTLQIDCK